MGDWDAFTCVESSDMFGTRDSEQADEPRTEFRRSDASERHNDQAVIHTHKLDVLSSVQINRLTILNLVIWFGCFAYLIITAVLANTVFLRWREVHQPDSGYKLRIKDMFYHPVYTSVEIGVALLISFCMFALAVVFTYRVVRNNRFPVSQEQSWVILTLITTALYMNPFFLFWLLHDFVILKADLLNPEVATGQVWYSQPWFRTLLNITWVIRSCGSTISTIFFLWASAHTYALKKGLYDGATRLRFYLPKVIPLLIYQFLRFMVRFPFNIALAQLPFSNLAAIVSARLILGVWHMKVVRYVLAITLFEVYFLIAIVSNVRSTARTLRDEDYLKTRSKQISFRYFCFHNLTYFVLMIFADVLIRSTIPRYFQLSFLLGPSKVHMHPNSVCKTVIDVMMFFNLAITSYVHLPPDSSGISGWWKPSTPKKNKGTGDYIEDEPLSLALYEADETVDDLENYVLQLGAHANTLYLETHVALLNFSWFAYLFGRHETDYAYDEKSHKLFRFTVYEYITDEERDTCLMVVNGNDRIIVAFKGTTSSQNLKTDLKIMMGPLVEVLPTYKSTNHPICDTQEWKRAKVHRGFMDAYQAVSQRVLDSVARLIAINPRPVMVTGHSLGGSLAAILSLDLIASLNLSKADILVSTWGSPRCGDFTWKKLYDKNVPIHWRFTVERDFISMLPKWGYKHVGKRVLLTGSGNLFLDPNSLEAVMWTGQVAAPIFHRKAAYMLSLKAFCMKYLAKFEPDFWEFEITPEELTLFEELSGLDFGSARSYSALRHSKKSLMRFSSTHLFFGSR